MWYSGGPIVGTLQVDRYEPDFERFRAAIVRDGVPDRVPNAETEVDLDMMAAFLGRPIVDLRSYVEFWQRAGYDYTVLQVRGQPIADSFQIRIAEGVTAMADASATVGTVGALAIPDESQFQGYPWIGPQDVYYRDVDEVADLMPSGMQLIVNHGPLFNGLHRMMGMDAFVAAYAENPALIRAVVDKCGELTLQIVESLVQRDWVGGIWLGDDLAYTQGLMVSPDFLRTYIFPYYRRVGELCRRYKKLFIFHSDGKLEQILEDLYACGVQALHPNEPTSVDIGALKREWGGRFAFIGNIDVDLLTRGTPAQIEVAVRDLVSVMAPGGGFALGSGNSVTRHVPLCNYRAMLVAAARYGTYG